MRLDLNSDIGESFGAWKMGADEEMLAIVTSANVACGFHAGDPSTMFKTAAEAKARGVAIGAHPGFADLWGFGRRVIRGDSLADIERMTAYQIGAFQAVAALAGHTVTHVKAHGALSNMINDEIDLAMAFGRGIKGVDPRLIYIAMPGLATERAAESLGLPYVREVFADRTYEDSGNLTSRSIPGSVIHDAETAAGRVLQMLDEGAIRTTSGKRIPATIDTVCVHGDNPGAVALARRLRTLLEEKGVELAPFAA